MEFEKFEVEVANSGIRMVGLRQLRRRRFDDCIRVDTPSTSKVATMIYMEKWETRNCGSDKGYRGLIVV